MDEDEKRPSEGGPLLLLPSQPNGRGGGIFTAREIKLALITTLVFSATVLRKHPERQIRKLARLISKYGFLIPILIDSENGIIAGEARVKAAQLLGMTAVPAIRVLHLTDPEIRALRIADNKLNEMSTWDKPSLTAELVDLDSILSDISISGFEIPELDLLIKAELPKPNDVALDDCPPADMKSSAVSAAGDVWLCGPHRVACGDCRDSGLLRHLMAGARATQLLSDVPYNVKIAGNVCGNGKVKHPEFAMASGEMSDEEFEAFLMRCIGLGSEHCLAGALLYIFIDWRHVHHVIAVGKRLELEYVNLCVWTKSNAGMGSFYRSQHELVAVFRKGGAAHINNIDLGRFGRNRSNVWPYEGANSINPERRAELGLHPTVKPTRLCADAILDCTARGDIVLDPFLGSGSTLIGAEDTGRVCYGVEISPHYVDVIVRRWQEFTGGCALLEGTQLSFPDVEAMRGAAEGRQR